jgi:hypothetical protein
MPLPCRAFVLFWFAPDDPSSHKTMQAGGTCVGLGQQRAEANEKKQKCSAAKKATANKARQTFVHVMASGLGANLRCALGCRSTGWLPFVGRPRRLPRSPWSTFFFVLLGLSALGLFLKVARVGTPPQTS